MKNKRKNKKTKKLLLSFHYSTQNDLWNKHAPFQDAKLTITSDLLSFRKVKRGKKQKKKKRQNEQKNGVNEKWTKRKSEKIKGMSAKKEWVQKESENFYKKL